MPPLQFFEKLSSTNFSRFTFEYFPFFIGTIEPIGSRKSGNCFLIIPQTLIEYSKPISGHQKAKAFYKMGTLARKGLIRDHSSCFLSFL